MFTFDDSRLQDPDVLAAADGLLRPLAEAGARIRREDVAAQGPLNTLDGADRPRALIIFGPEARLVRSVLEPTCPVPLVAWPRLGLPGWVGPLDIVVVLGGGDRTSLAAAFEAVRRGCQLLVAAPAESALARESASKATTLLPTSTGDPLAAAVVALAGLNRLGLGPTVNPHGVAAAMDRVAETCAARLDATENPAKLVALELAEAQPLVWGGSVLAARASRRIAEALRAASGRIGLAADASALEPLLTTTPPRDPFADPFDEVASVCRPGLVLIDDDRDDELAAEERDRLTRIADAQDIKISRLSHTEGSVVERYATVLQQGLFAAAYLSIGLGTAPR
ncbi:phosphoglucose isomerase-like protein [Propionicimonas paludicola]|uniref:Phosphoglucose isomerase-like protein n=1 Tax=Propionicimonas paludicola TaxID=185243 RepID=A0A2A9CNZ6_9ACTN|nr:SIS domain-containing protein [Propionicimonas paludicola]PFG15921.1 phosphoglucose isomerase-like protein [Propionicimonas paludicola]